VGADDQDVEVEEVVVLDPELFEYAHGEDGGAFVDVGHEIEL
jgi:hypothetical protein